MTGALEALLLEAWQARGARLPAGLRREWEEALGEAGQEERPYLRYVFSTLPLSDLGEYPPRLFQECVRKALAVREESPWCGGLPEHIFLKDVLYPRVNTEELEACSRFAFYEELAPLVRGLALPDAILEVNRWCAGQVTYRSTDDRTSSPMAVYRRGWGRCGEESTFTVAALRSVGIPARQVYAPWWSHCDDNHAWVEAWDGGDWRYLGACEPEPELDRGWFTGAAARAMLLHTRAFVGDLPETGQLFPGVDPLDLDVREGVAYESLTARYAPVRPFAVTVTGAGGIPVPGAEITFSVLNMGAFRPVARRITNEKGQARLRLGLGSLWLTARKEGLLAEALVDTGAFDEAALALAEPQAGAGSFRFNSPRAPRVFPAPLSPEQKASRKAVLEQAEALRREKREKGNVPPASPGPGGEGPAKEDQGWKRAVYRSLTRKDRADGVWARIWEDCAPALKWEGRSPQEAFEKYVLCPRLGLEPLRPWREEAAKNFTQEQMQAFQAEPRRLWDWVQREVAPIGCYGELPQGPVSALRLRAAGEQAKQALFCGLCRVAGVPARLSPVDGQPEFWQEGRFVPLEAHSAALGLEISCEKAGGACSLSHLGPEGWRLLHLQPGEAALKPGLYRLLACLRLPGGDQLVQRQDFYLEPGQKREIRLEIPQASSRQLLQCLPLPAFSLFDLAGQERPAAALLEESPYSLFCWLEPGREPTEHLLLELKEAADGFANWKGKCALHLVTEGPGAPLEGLPWARRWEGGFSGLAGLARQLFVDPERLPLVLLADSAGRGLYACAGYNVGLARLLLQLLAAAG